MAVVLAARRLVELRDRWLSPPEWVEWVDEPVPGYPQRPVPRDEDAAKALKKRTLTSLYNSRPQWLADAHEALDAAVAAAYGWPADTGAERRRPVSKAGMPCGPWTASMAPWIPARQVRIDEEIVTGSHDNNPFIMNDLRAFDS